MTGTVSNTFVDLSYEHQRRRLRSLATTLLTSYDLQARRLKLLNYEDNAVYQVQSPNARVQQWAVASLKRRVRHLEEYHGGQLLAL
ncbi:MAG: hypothetical protein GEU73_11365 [Chloroflexi bacterium]|nr:hypothetical protein [Chloroflexota bacterium]